MSRIIVGQECSTGQVVSEIFGQSTKATVFTTTDDHLRWQFHENNGDVYDYLRQSVHDFDSLMSVIKQHIEGRQQKNAYERLAKSLFAALNMSEAEAKTNLGSCFEQVRLLIEQTTSRRARFIYTTTATIFAVVLVLALTATGKFFLQDNILFVVGAIFGSAGAAVSVMQRTRDINIDPFQASAAIRLQGILKIGLGGVFGVFFVFASKANLAMGTISDDGYGLAVFSFIAGFSERFVPELLEKLDGTTKNGQGD